MAAAIPSGTKIDPRSLLHSVGSAGSDLNASTSSLQVFLFENIVNIKNILFIAN